MSYNNDSHIGSLHVLPKDQEQSMRIQRIGHPRWREDEVIEMDDLRKTAEEARRRLTRARYMP